MFKSNGKFSNTTLLIILVIVCLLGGFIIALYNSSYIERFSTASAKFTVEYYYMNNCGHCTDFKPEWEKFKKQVKSSDNYDTASYNISDESVGSARAVKFNITGTPTIIITDKNDKNVATFEDSRTVAKLVAFANNNTKNAV